MNKTSVVIVGLVMALSFPATVFAVPEMSFETVRHDFGSVTAGEQLHFGFQFSNTGDEDLQITRLNPS